DIRVGAPVVEADACDHFIDGDRAIPIAIAHALLGNGGAGRDELCCQQDCGAEPPRQRWAELEAAQTHVLLMPCGDARVSTNWARGVSIRSDAPGLERGTPATAALPRLTTFESHTRVPSFLHQEDSRVHVRSNDPGHPNSRAIGLHPRTV